MKSHTVISLGPAIVDPETGRIEFHLRKGYANEPKAMGLHTLVLMPGTDVASFIESVNKNFFDAGWPLVSHEDAERIQDIAAKTWAERG